MKHSMEIELDRGDLKSIFVTVWGEVYRTHFGYGARIISVHRGDDDLTPELNDAGKSILEAELISDFLKDKKRELAVNY